MQIESDMVCVVEHFFLADVLFLGSCLRLGSSSIWVNKVVTIPYLNFVTSLQWTHKQHSENTLISSVLEMFNY
jgi:hypothetical protein